MDEVQLTWNAGVRFLSREREYHRDVSPVPTITASLTEPPFASHGAL
jgi:hypothetical protein